MLTKGDKWESKPTIAKMQTGHTFPISTKNNIPVFWTVSTFFTKKSTNFAKTETPTVKHNPPNDIQTS
jgi:hypothetical protein